MNCGFMQQPICLVGCRMPRRHEHREPGRSDLLEMTGIYWRRWIRSTFSRWRLVGGEVAVTSRLSVLVTNLRRLGVDYLLALTGCSGWGSS